MAEMRNLEDMHDDIPTTAEGQKQADEALLLSGWFNSVPELTATVEETEEDGKPLRTVRLNGKFTNGARTGYASIWLDLDDRYFEARDGNAPDQMRSTKLMYQAANVYRLAHGIDKGYNVNKVAVAKYLTKYAFGVKFGAGKTLGKAVAISAAKE